MLWLSSFQFIPDHTCNTVLLFVSTLLLVHQEPSQAQGSVLHFVQLLRPLCATVQHQHTPWKCPVHKLRNSSKLSDPLQLFWVQWVVLVLLCYWQRLAASYAILTQFDTAHTKWYRSSELVRSFVAFLLLWKAHHHQLHHHQLHHHQLLQHQLLWLLLHRLCHRPWLLQLWLLRWLHQHRDPQLSAMTPLLITPLLLSLYQLAPNILLILLFFHSNQPLVFLIRTTLSISSVTLYTGWYGW